MTLELNEIIEALKELESVIFIKHYWKTIAIIEQETKIKDFEIKKDFEKWEIILKFKSEENEF